MEPFDRKRFDAFGRLQRFDLEAQPAARLLFRRALTLHLFHFVPVTQQLEMLPGREQEREHEKRGDAERFPELALPRFVDLADDRVVANVFLDRVLERLRHGYASLSAARSFALRARGLLWISSSRAMSGFFVSTLTPAPRCSRPRSVCFTIRSSSE